MDRESTESHLPTDLSEGLSYTVSRIIHVHIYLQQHMRLASAVDLLKLKKPSFPKAKGRSRIIYI